MGDKRVRVVGVDFGTSSSVVVFKDFDLSPDGGLVSDTSDVSPVPDEVGSSPLIPSVAFRGPDGDCVFGGRAETEALAGEDVRRRFKLALDKEVPDGEDVEAVAGFLKFLHSRVECLPRVKGVDLSVQTVLGVPVSWSPRAKQSLVDAALKAEFDNVRSVAESYAAMAYFANVSTPAYDALLREKVIEVDKPVTVLLLDMGAGTTDLALFEYVPGPGIARDPVTGPTPKLLQAASPKAWAVSGGELDQLLWDRTLGPLVPADHWNGYTQAGRASSERELRAKVVHWKVVMFAKRLRENITPSTLPIEFATLRKCAPGELPKIDRTGFERQYRDYLDAFAALVSGFLDEHDRPVDLVVLTGGHSHWYWVTEMLTGTMPGIDTAHLDRARKNPKRVLATEQRQETVARGLVWSALNTIKGTDGTAGLAPALPWNKVDALVRVWIEIKLKEDEAVDRLLVHGGHVLAITPHRVLVRGGGDTFMATHVEMSAYCQNLEPPTPTRTGWRVRLHTKDTTHPFDCPDKTAALDLISALRQRGRAHLNPERRAELQAQDERNRTAIGKHRAYTHATPEQREWLLNLCDKEEFVDAGHGPIDDAGADTLHVLTTWRTAWFESGGTTAMRIHKAAEKVLPTSCATGFHLAGHTRYRGLTHARMTSAQWIEAIREHRKRLLAPDELAPIETAETGKSIACETTWIRVMIGHYLRKGCARLVKVAARGDTLPKNWAEDLLVSPLFGEEELKSRSFKFTVSTEHGNCTLDDVGKVICEVNTECVGNHPALYLKGDIEFFDESEKDNYQLKKLAFANLGGKFDSACFLEPKIFATGALSFKALITTEYSRVRSLDETGAELAERDEARLLKKFASKETRRSLTRLLEIQAPK